jgi:hypothetical protein
VLIIKGVKVLCFDTLLQVLILQGLFAQKRCKVPGLTEVRKMNGLGLLSSGGFARDNTHNYAIDLYIYQ